MTRDVPSKPPWILHPFLFASFRVLALHVANSDMSELSATPSPILLLSAEAALVMAALRLWVGWQRAGLLTLLGLIGQTLPMPEGWEIALLAVVGGLAVVVIRWPGTCHLATRFANATMLLMVLFTLVGESVQLAEPRVLKVRPNVLADLPLPASPPRDRPDIWWIIADAHARADVLAAKFGIPDGLSASLERKGFYVARESHSNYAQTVFSFASFLNFAYLDDLLVGTNSPSDSRMPVRDLVGVSRAVETLRRLGYRIVDYPTGYRFTDLRDADEVNTSWLRMGEFRGGLLTSTAVPYFMGLTTGYQGRLQHALRRHQINWTLDRLKQEPAHADPTFTLVHLLVPHPPFVFMPDGSYRPARGVATLSDGSHWKEENRDTGESYRDGYRDQVLWLDRQLDEVIDAILAHARTPPVVILQSDHGSGMDVEWENVERTDVGDRLAILNAYYWPGQDYRRLYPSITPVNSFRVVLNQVFGADVPLLPDRSYFHTWLAPYRFIEVTDRVQARPVATLASHP